jgi:hypothetical protein
MMKQKSTELVSKKANEAFFFYTCRHCYRKEMSSNFRRKSFLFNETINQSDFISKIDLRVFSSYLHRFECKKIKFKLSDKEKHVVSNLLQFAIAAGT